MQTVMWTPQTCEEAERARASLEFFHGDGVGLHLNREAIASVWLWTGQCGCCAEKRWSVEVADARNQIGLAFMAGDDASESDWRSLLKTCLP